MSYLVLARKWRPKTFTEVVGQQHILRALINGLDHNRLHHAFLFSGTSGVGKTSLARILAKSLNCEQGISSLPCCKCYNCQEVDSGHFVDLIEVDAASRTKVDDTRALLDNAQYAPTCGRYKVYLIDEVHMLSTSSFNALLKTLEEPPQHIKFLFATTESQKLPVTILSRCLQFNLRRLDIKQISEHLKHILRQEKIKFELNALLALARAADGNLRDALSLLDQAISFGGGLVTYEHVYQMLGNIDNQQLYNIMAALLKRDYKGLLAESLQLSIHNRDFTVAFNELLSLLQRIATVQLVPDLESTEEGDLGQIKELAQKFSPENIQLIYQIALHGKRDLAYAASPKSGFEMTLLRMLSFQPKMINKYSVSDNTTSIQNNLFKNTSIGQQPNNITDQVPTNKKIKEMVEPQTKIERINEANWTQIIATLKLTALARQLANNCAFVRSNRHEIYLSLLPELDHLATPKAQERLKLALSKRVGYKISIIFEQNKNSVNGHNSLTSEYAKQDTMKQQRAIASIHNDPAVNAMKQVFDAHIIENSIKSID